MQCRRRNAGHWRRAKASSLITARLELTNNGDFYANKSISYLALSAPTLVRSAFTTTIVFNSTVALELARLESSVECPLRLAGASHSISPSACSIADRVVACCSSWVIVPLLSKS